MSQPIRTARASEIVNYARHTLGAMADAVVPETPALAAERGDEHEPGAIAAGLDAHLVEAFDGLQEVHGPLSRVIDTYPYALVLALLLDVAALELLLRRRTRDGLGRRAVPTRGPYTLLSRHDRLRAIGLLESDGVLARLDDRFRERVPHLGVVKYLVGGAVTVTQLAYYSEWGADGEPTPETVQGWEQTGYPGPSDGYAVFRGYEVEAFEEDDY